MTRKDDLRDRVARNAGVRPAQPGEVRCYLVRALDGDPTTTPRIIEITVPAACPARVGIRRCGMARGTPEKRVLHDSWTGTDYTVTVPANHPCGHTTMHARLIAEHVALAASMGETA